VFLKKIKFFYFKLIFFGIFRSFLCVDVTNNFFKIIKNIILIYFQAKKYFKKQSLPHSQTPSKTFEKQPQSQPYSQTNF
jgi:hypothetical protein